MRRIATVITLAVISLLGFNSPVLAAFEKVPLDKVWTITFNKPIDKSSVNENTIYITDVHGDDVPTVYSFKDDRTVLVDAVPDYLPGQLYFLDINGVTSSGKALKEPVSTKFTTIPATTPHSAYIEQLRSTETTIMDGFTLSLAARIDNMVTEVTIHKFREESEAKFEYQVKRLMYSTSSDYALTLAAKQFNQICYSLLAGAITDDEAISQLKELRK